MGPPTDRPATRNSPWVFSQADYEALLKELKSIQTTQTATLAELRAENQSLRNEVKFCYKVVEGHQRFLERLDARERACNVVITGVPEENWMDTDDDAKKRSD